MSNTTVGARENSEGTEETAAVENEKETVVLEQGDSVKPTAESSSTVVKEKETAVIEQVNSITLTTEPINALEKAVHNIDDATVEEIELGNTVNLVAQVAAKILQNEEATDTSSANKTLLNNTTAIEDENNASDNNNVKNNGKTTDKQFICKDSSMHTNDDNTYTDAYNIVDSNNENIFNYTPSPERKQYLDMKKQLLLPCTQMHLLFSHGIHTKQHNVPHGAFERNEHIQRIKDKLLPINSRPHRRKKLKRCVNLEKLYKTFLPQKKSQRNEIGIGNYALSESSSYKSSVHLEKLWDPPFSMASYIPDTVSGIRVQVSKSIEGENTKFVTTNYSYAGKNGKLVPDKANDNALSRSGDKALDEILDLSFDEMLQRDYPHGIKINELMPEVKIEDATEEYDWFDKVSDDEDDDMEGIDVLAPLVSKKYTEKHEESQRNLSPQGLYNAITWDDMDDGHGLNEYLQDNDSDVDSMFDIQYTNDIDGRNRAKQDHVINNQQEAPSSPVHSMIDRKFSGNEDVYISDTFSSKIDNNTPNRPPPQIANISTPWSGTVTTAVMPTNQGMWVFVPQPPATEPGRMRNRQNQNGLNRNSRFQYAQQQQKQHQQRQQPQYHNRSKITQSELKITRSWNLDDVGGTFSNNNRDTRRARTTSPRNRNQYFHYNTRNGHHPMGNTLATSPPRGANSSHSPRRLFTDNDNISTYTNDFNNNNYSGSSNSSNPHQRIRALKDMISSLESSIGALRSGEVAPM
jgi:hypothetical protein